MSLKLIFIKTLINSGFSSRDNESRDGPTPREYKVIYALYKIFEIHYEFFEIS